MLKTLRITSLIAAILAASGVVLIVIMGLRADADIVALLDKPGVSELFADQAGGQETTEQTNSPLVTQALAFALRIDPPPPPRPKDPPKLQNPPKSVETARKAPVKPRPEPPRPKAPVNAKFTLLATVQCVDNPEKSLALLQTAPGKQEWFWQGQQVGHLDIEEVRDGSVIFSQKGSKQQELFVPVKTEVKSILKQDNLSTARPAGPGSLNVLLNPDGTASAEAGTQIDSQIPAFETESGAVRMPRSRITNPRSNASSGIRRMRSVPKPPTPEERKAEIENDIANVADMMSNQNLAEMSEEERAKDKENWRMLIEILQSEKELVEKKQQAQTPPSSESEVKKSPPPGDISSSKKEVPKEKVDVTRKRPSAPKEEK